MGQLSVSEPFKLLCHLRPQSSRPEESQNKVLASQLGYQKQNACCPNQIPRGALPGSGELTRELLSVVWEALSSGHS